MKSHVLMNLVIRPPKNQQYIQMQTYFTIDSCIFEGRNVGRILCFINMLPFKNRIYQSLKDLIK